MGRSQVLYNRTKGRYKNRGGGTGGGGGRSDRGEPNPGRGRGGGGGRRGRGIRSQPQPHHPPDPPTTTTTKQRRTPRYDESILLEPPTRIYKTAVVDDIELSTIGGSGSIDVRSMAAAFTTSLTLSQRLFIPPHIAQVLESAAAPAEEEENNYSTDAEKVSMMSPAGTQSQSDMSPVQRIKQRQLLKNSLLKSPPSSPGGSGGGDRSDNEQDVRYATPSEDVDYDDFPASGSYSVDTRRPTKVRVNQDGQVEVRNKTIHQRKEPPPDPPSPGAPIPPTIAESQNSNYDDDFDDVMDDIDGLIFSGVGRVAVNNNDSPTGLLKDRYMVLEADDDDTEYEQEESKRTIRNVPTDENQKEESKRTIHNVPTDERYLTDSVYTEPSATQPHVSAARGGHGKPSLAIKTTDLEDDDEESSSFHPPPTSNKKSTPAAAAARAATGNRNASSTPVHKNHSKYSTPNNKTATATKKKASKKAPPPPKIKESESMLDDWLDHAMKSVSNDDSDFPTLPESIVRGVQHEYITRSEEEELEGDSHDVSTDTASTVSSLTRSTLTPSYVDSAAEKTVTSRCYTHDSRGKLFEDLEEDGTILEEEEDESTSQHYTEPTKSTTQKKPKPSKQSKSTKKSSRKEEKDLDDWLDSVIS